jgi:hypothetical protein
MGVCNQGVAREDRILILSRQNRHGTSTTSMNICSHLYTFPVQRATRSTRAMNYSCLQQTNNWISACARAWYATSHSLIVASLCPIVAEAVPGNCRCRQPTQRVWQSVTKQWVECPWERGRLQRRPHSMQLPCCGEEKGEGRKKERERERERC